MRKKAQNELSIRIKWSSGHDPSEERPFDEVAKGLTSEVIWSFALMGILFGIVVLIWLVSP